MKTAPNLRCPSDGGVPILMAPRHFVSLATLERGNDLVSLLIELGE